MSADESEIVTLKVRVTSAFREKIQKVAKDNNRSMNAEIVDRLEQSLVKDTKSEMRFSNPEFRKNLERAFSVLAQIEGIEEASAQGDKRIINLTVSKTPNR